MVMSLLHLEASTPWRILDLLLDLLPPSRSLSGISCLMFPAILLLWYIYSDVAFFAFDMRLFHDTAPIYLSIDRAGLLNSFSFFQAFIL